MQALENNNTQKDDLKMKNDAFKYRHCWLAFETNALLSPLFLYIVFLPLMSFKSKRMKESRYL